LRVLLDPMSPTHTEKAIRDAEAMFRQKKTLKLYKSVSNFPTGLKITATATEALSRRASDKNHLDSLDRALKKLGELDMFAPGDSWEILVKKAIPFKEMFSAAIRVQANSSGEFQMASVVKMNLLDKGTLQVRDGLRDHAFADCDKCLDAVYDQWTEIMAAVNEGRAQEDNALNNFALTISAFMENLKLPTVFLKDVAPTDYIDRVAAPLDAAKNVVTTLRCTLQPLMANGQGIDPSDSGHLALYQLVVAAPTLLRVCQSYPEFRRVAEVRLGLMYDVKLNSIITPCLKAPQVWQAFAELVKNRLGLSKFAGDFSEVDVKMLTLAASELVNVATMFPEWWSRKVDISQDRLDFTEELSCPALVLLIAPRLFQLLHGSMALQGAALQAASSDDAATNFNVVLDNIKNLHLLGQVSKSDYNKMRPVKADSSASDFQTADDISSILDDFEGKRKALVKETIKQWVLNQSEHSVSMEGLASEAALVEVSNIIDQGCNDGSLNSALQAAQGKHSRQLHNACKDHEAFVETHNAIMSCMPDLDQDDKTLMATVDLERKAARTLNCTLAVIQAICRPLRADETRSSLARRARLMVATKVGITLQPNLDMYLNMIASELPAREQGTHGHAASPGKSAASSDGFTAFPEAASPGKSAASSVAASSAAPPSAAVTPAAKRAPPQKELPAKRQKK
jgi:hypothetical protein